MAAQSLYPTPTTQVSKFDNIKEDLERQQLARSTFSNFIQNQESEVIKVNYKRHIISALVTFAAGFAIVIVPELDKLTVDNLTDGALLGLLFSGVRAGFKLLLESFLTWYNRR